MYKKIIFPIDLSAKNSWDYCFPTVISLVKAFEAELYLMSVIPDYGISLVKQYFPKGWVKEAINKAEADLKKISEKHAKDVNVKYIVEQGAVYQTIIDKANEVGADLIALPAHRPELRDYLLGPNAAKVVRHADISVLIIRAND